MKTFRMIGMALFAVLMCVNFASCGGSDDDPTEEGVVTNGKKLISITEEYDSDGGLYTYSFAYDNKDRVMSVTTKDYYYETPITRVTNIEWDNNLIIESRNREKLTLTIADGRVIKGQSSEDGCNYSFAYDSSKRLSASEHYHSNDYDNSSCSYSWDNNKLVKYTYTDDYDKEEIQIKYNGQTCKGFFPLWGQLVEDDCYTLFVHPELVGLRNNYLPSQIVEKDEDNTDICRFAYTFDEDGYIETCTATTNDGGYIETIVYTFKWQ